MPVTKAVFDSSANVTLYTLSSGSLKVNIIDYGATIVSILFKDKTGAERDLVLGFDDLDGYQSKRLRNPYFGATIGRFGNRIGTASFDLDGKHYPLVANNGPNSLHGGGDGFDKKVWTLVEEGDAHITLSYTSDHMEMGYPGKLVCKVKFVVSPESELKLDYTAELVGDQSKSTIVNLTNHSYFNLNGVFDATSNKVLNHEMRMQSAHYLEVDENLIPSGKLVATKGTNFDFQTGKHTIGERVEDVKPNGYDHCFVLEADAAKYRIDPQTIAKAVEVYSPLTGIKMTFSTTEPAFQLYSGSKIVEGHRPKHTQNTNVTYGPYSGFCLEAQRFPDAIHQENWAKQVVLSSGETYKQVSVYKFELSDAL